VLLLFCAAMLLAMQFPDELKKPGCLIAMMLVDVARILLLY